MRREKNAYRDRSIPKIPANEAETRTIAARAPTSASGGPVGTVTYTYPDVATAIVTVARPEEDTSKTNGVRSSTPPSVPTSVVSPTGGVGPAGSVVPSNTSGPRASRIGTPAPSTAAPWRATAAPRIG